MKLSLKKKVNLLIIGKHSLLSRIFLDNTKIKYFSVYSRNDLNNINFNIYTHIINFSFNPTLKKKKYKKKIDFDFKLSEIVKEYSIIYIMISTRLVYSNFKRRLNESTKIYKPITKYGQNKLIIEENIRKKLPSKHLILRVSNILYNDITKKKNLFFYNALRSLKIKNKILLNFSSSTFKDFITPKYFTRSLDRLILSNSIGTYNFCSGIKIKVQDIVEKIIEGYGKGKFLYSSKKIVNESFFMSNRKLYKKTKIYLSIKQIMNYSFNMGKALRNE
jgi:dTDP-4-dehydrorhamnose reductase